MIPEGVVRIALPTAADDTVRPGAPGFGWLGRAIARRGAVLVEDPVGGVDHAFVGAPPTILGPPRVRALRQRIGKGLRLLLVAGPRGDAPYLLSGLEVVDDDGEPVRFRLRGRAAFDSDPRDRGVGQLWPTGRGWFRFGRSFDVVAGEGERIDERGRAADPRWSWLQVRLGHGALTAVAGAGALAGPGSPPDLAVDPARVPALRALGEAGLARAFGLRVRLTDAGRADRDRVRAVLLIREVLRALDLADEPTREEPPQAVG